MKTLLLFLSLTFAAVSNAQTGAYAYYPFSGNANDASGNNRNGTLHGNPTLTTDRQGNANSAYLFDGVNDYVQLPQAFDFKPRTISLWFKPMSFSVEGVIFSSDNASTLHSDSKIVANESGGSYTLTMKIGSNPYVQTLNLNQWYHAALVFSDTAIMYYINGGLVGTFYNLANLHSGNGVAYATIGTHRGLINYFHGVIDEVIINDRALSAEEINGVYTSIVEPAPGEVISCFPNPTTGILRFNCDKPIMVQVADIQGGILLQRMLESDGEIDLAAYPNGVYCVTADSKSTGVLSRKLIIKQ